MKIFYKTFSVSICIVPFTVFALLTSCSLYDTPTLPDINKQSFSYDMVIKEKTSLIEKHKNETEKNYNENNLE